MLCVATRAVLLPNQHSPAAGMLSAASSTSGVASAAAAQLRSAAKLGGWRQLNRMLLLQLLVQCWQGPGSCMLGAECSLSAGRAPHCSIEAWPWSEQEGHTRIIWC